MEKKTVMEYSFFAFCQSVQELIEEGYVFDLENNENAPTTFGAFFQATMLKKPKAQKQKKAQTQEDSKPDPSEPKAE